MALTVPMAKKVGRRRNGSNPQQEPKGQKHLNRLPLLLSVPHAGFEIPDELRTYHVLTTAQIIADGDAGAASIYLPLSELVHRLQTTSIARVFIDLNRAPDDFSSDGVVKTHTCWNEPIYRTRLSTELCETLLQRYYYPYHNTLRENARAPVVLGVDCHTMAANGPPIGPDPGQPRPKLCLSNARGSCPADWFEALAGELEEAFDCEVARNWPFKGGYIVRSQGHFFPWVQLEINRAAFLSDADKSACLCRALIHWCKNRAYGPGTRNDL